MKFSEIIDKAFFEYDFIEKFITKTCEEKPLVLSPKSRKRTIIVISSIILVLSLTLFVFSWFPLIFYLENFNIDTDNIFLMLGVDGIYYDIYELSYDFFFAEHLSKGFGFWLLWADVVLIIVNLIFLKEYKERFMWTKIALAFLAFSLIFVFRPAVYNLYYDYWSGV